LQQLGIEPGAVEVDGGYLMLPCEGKRQVVLRYEAQLDQAIPDPGAPGPGISQCPIKLLPRDDAIANQQFADSYGRRDHRHIAECSPADCAQKTAQNRDFL